MSFKRYSAAEFDFLRRNYKAIGNKALGEALGRSADSIKDKMKRCGLKRTENELRTIKQQNNTGHFKKGRLPHNANYNGHERITKDGYVEVRIKRGVYILKHLHNWQKVNGKLPSGWCLKCRDGNKQNIDLSNWKLITRAENMLNNTRHEIPKELIPIMAALSHLKQKVKKLEYGKK